MRGYRISLFRHGQTDANEKGIYIGHTDYPLSEKGASELYNKLDEFMYPHVAKVYSSPLRRCTETAEILFPEVELQTLPNLIEMNFGAYEGKSAAELVEEEAFHAWLTGGADSRPPEGESFAEVQVRVFKALFEIIKDMMQNDILHAAVVTHSGIISTLVSGFAVPKVDARELMPKPGEGYDLLATASLWQRANAVELLGMTPYHNNFED